MRILGAILWIVAFQLVGAAVGYFSNGGESAWYAGIEKPSFNPPNWIFPVAWSSLYVMIALAGWRIWGRRSEEGGMVRVGLFWAQMGMNWTWSFIFFVGHDIGLALIWLAGIDLLVALLIAKSWKRDRLAAGLLLPYLMWGVFAAVLNWSIWNLNR